MPRFHLGWLVLCTCVAGLRCFCHGFAWKGSQTSFSFQVQPPRSQATTRTAAFNQLLRDNKRLSMHAVVDIDRTIFFPQSLFRPLRIIWDFSRPHTVIGSIVSIATLFLFATPRSLWGSHTFLSSLGASLLPSLLTNLYITGLNQLTDVDIDKVNKPYLPVASGALSQGIGSAVVILSMLSAIALTWSAAWPLKSTVLGSAFLGTIYSLPPFRLKRFPLLAAFCILVVRGTLVNLGFFLQAKTAVLGKNLPFALPSLHAYPESVLAASFFALFGLVIALMKDVPDISGDVQNNIRTFSVQAGASRMFRYCYKLVYCLYLFLTSCCFYCRISSKLLYVLLFTYSIIAGLSATGANSLSIVLQKLQTFDISTFKWSSAAVATTLAGLGWDVRKRSKIVDTGSSKNVFDFYMHTWNVFYTCYLLLPILRL